MKPCPKAGIKIHESNNDYRGNKPSQLAKPVDFHNTSFNTLDLDLDHYSLDDLYHLFNIPDGELTPASTHAVQTVLSRPNATPP